MSRNDSLEMRLIEIVGSDHVIDRAPLQDGYCTDWTRRFRGQARAVVRPADAEQVASVLAVCHRAGVPVVPQGGNTGLVGGGVPRGGEVLLSLSRLRTLEPVDEIAAELVAGAGVTLGALQAQAAGVGLAFGVDLAARDSATVGGLIATNAGGIHVLRYGQMRAQVVGIEAVLADGRPVGRLHGVAKESAGYDLRALLAGSEGTLAVITAARLRLVPRLPRRIAALIGVDDAARAVALGARLRATLEALHALELLDEAAMRLVGSHRGWAPPLARPWPYSVLVEAAAQGDPTEGFVSALHDAVAADEEVALALDQGTLAHLWEIREATTEAINAQGVPHKLDVAVPIGRLAELLERVGPVVARVDGAARTVVFGHLAEGNMHVNVLGPPADDPRVDAAVLDLVLALGGTISAEHGIGVAKVAWLERARGSSEVALMRAMKHAIDPSGLLNPGVLLP